MNSSNGNGSSLYKEHHWKCASCATNGKVKVLYGASINAQVRAARVEHSKKRPNCPGSMEVTQ